MSNDNPSARETIKLDDLANEGRRIQELVEKVQTIDDPAARAMLQDCLESVLTFYGHGLSRILQVIDRAGPEAGKVREALLQDNGVAGLLLIHGLHPVPLETRLSQALEKVRPYMQSHGGDVELLSLENDFALLRLKGHCETCPSSTVTLELAVRHALEEACPDLAGFEVEGGPKNGLDSSAPASFEHTPKSAPQWIEIKTNGQLESGGLTIIHEGSEPLIVCKAEGQLYAYYDRCPGCNMPLHLGKLDGTTLTCGLGHRYDVRRAGLSLDQKDLHLDPVPLLEQNGQIRIALTHTHASGGREEPARA
jgi:Fe-S cluster biogenesis protein NfuA/nitrite reductase/ring-hydroxylating ferredoxin subunit